jgi:hypothetical protein
MAVDGIFTQYVDPNGKIKISMKKYFSSECQFQGLGLKGKKCFCSSQNLTDGLKSL